MTWHTARRSFIALCLSVIAACALLQAQQSQQSGQQFQPQVGQAGKDVVWVPTPQVLVDKMLDMAKVTPSDYVMDLGSGDGRTVISAAKLGARAVGVEFNPDMVELSRKNAAAAGVSGRATFIQGDLFEADLSKATVITMFLLPDINMKLRPKLLDLKPGTRIVSNSFDMEDWEPDERATVTEGCSSWCTAMLWIIPAKVEGTWRLAQGELTLQQKFQRVSGTLSSGGRETAVTSGLLHGDHITFVVGGAEYSGVVSGDVIQGTMKSAGKSTNWSARRVS
jgi:hypothetical protein